MQQEFDKKLENTLCTHTLSFCYLFFYVFLDNFFPEIPKIFYSEFESNHNVLL